MTQGQDQSKNVWVLTPIAGISLFVIFYFVATILYPGGSQFDKNAVGFSWINNYWCNLLNEKAINGQHNSARPVAMTGMFLLCVTLSFFWYVFPRHVGADQTVRLAIQVCGLTSMSIAFFLFTGINHDLIINLASGFGLIAIAGMFVGLYKKKWFGLFAFGLINLLLVGLNHYCYYHKDFIIFLPVVQKVSFASFLIWFCCIDLVLHRDTRYIVPYVNLNSTADKFI